MTLLRTLLWFVVAVAVMLGAVWLAERPGTVTAEWQGWRLDSSVGALVRRHRRADPGLHRPVAALSLDHGRAGGVARRLGREPAPARLSRAHPGTGRRRGRRRQRSAEACAQGREAPRRAGAHAAAVGAGRPAHRRSRGRQSCLHRHARRRADGLPRPARPDRPGVARRRPGQGARLCRARLPAPAADALGGPFAVRHAGAGRPVEGGPGHAGHAACAARSWRRTRAAP